MSMAVMAAAMAVMVAAMAVMAAGILDVVLEAVNMQSLFFETFDFIFVKVQTTICNC